MLPMVGVFAVLSHSFSKKITALKKT